MPEQIRKTRFTMIEMVTVMIIIIIMFGMGVGALHGVGVHKGTEGGARMMTRMLELTRQHAIAENTRVALMMPLSTSAFTSQQPDNSTDIAGSGGHPTGAPVDTPGIILRPAIVSNANTPVFQRWVKGSKWEVFPLSVYFSNGSPVNITFTETESKTVIANGTQKGIVFKSNGSLTEPSNAKIYVKPFNVNSTAASYHPGDASVYEINVNWLTGKITTTQWKKVGSSWITIAN